MYHGSSLDGQLSLDKLKINQTSYYNLPNSVFGGLLVLLCMFLWEPFWRLILGYVPNGKKYVLFFFNFKETITKEQKKTDLKKFNSILWHLNRTVPQQIVF